MPEQVKPSVKEVVRKYAINLPIYDVTDTDTGELLSTGIDMKEVIRRHSAIIEHLTLIRVNRLKEY